MVEGTEPNPGWLNENKLGELLIFLQFFRVLMHKQLSAQKLLDSKEEKRKNDVKGSSRGRAGLGAFGRQTLWTLSPGEWFPASRDGVQ